MNKTDYLSQYGCKASSDHLKALRVKTEIFLQKKAFSSRLQHRNPVTQEPQPTALQNSNSRLQHQFFLKFLACMPVLHISDLPTPTITQPIKNSLSLSFSLSLSLIRCHLMTGTHVEECVLRRFHPCVNIRVYLHKPRWYSLLRP